MNDAIVGLIGVLIGCVATMLISSFTLKYNYRELFAKTVSENRMIWINTIREAISKIISIYIAYNALYLTSDASTECTKQKADLFINFYENISVVRTRMNPNEYKHQILDRYLSRLKLDNKLPPEYVENDLTFIITDLMKVEWERVKKEARGKKNV